MALAVDALRERGHELRVLTSNYGDTGAAGASVRRCLHGIHESADPFRTLWLEWEDAQALEDELRGFRPQPYLYFWNAWLAK